MAKLLGGQSTDNYEGKLGSTIMAKLYNTVNFGRAIHPKGYIIILYSSFRKLG